MSPGEGAKVGGMRASSVDLRTRVVAAVDRQVGSQGAVAQLFGVSRTFVKKLLRQRRETGSVAPKSHSGGHPPKLAEKQREVVRSYVQEQKNDASLAEVQHYVKRRLKVSVSPSTVSRVLQNLDLPRKKNGGRQ
jgi:transposase